MATREFIQPNPGPPAAPGRSHRIGDETRSSKNSRYALQTTGAFLILIAIVAFFALPSHGGTPASLLIAGLLLAWTQS
jgi:VIT1/CCC1 family predicted Fe2+/Mn2+ transporter